MNRRFVDLSSTPRPLAVGLFVFVIAVAGACHKQPQPAPAPAPAARTPVPAARNPVTITSGQGLIRAMHERYSSTWYHSLTFVQKTTVTRTATDTIVQTWYEAGEMPGRLRIDTDLKSKGGVLYAHDSTYSFANGKLVRADTGVNELLVLGFDVYTQPTEKSIALLNRLGFDLGKMHEATWQGSPVYVVGAARGDTLSKQFWVTRDGLLFVREISPGRRGRAEFRFNKYVRSNGGWVAAEVEQFVNGKRSVLEQYSNIRTNVTLPEGFLDPARWATAPHWYKP